MKIRTITHLLLLATLPQVAAAQTLTVGAGTAVKMSGATLRCSNANLKVSGKLAADDNSLIVMSNNNDSKNIGGNGELGISTLKVDGSVTTNRDLTVEKDVVFQSGVLNIRGNNLYLRGQLVGETENSYLTATTGEVISTVQVAAGQSCRLLGLTASPREDYTVEVHRGHTSTRKGRETSVNRYYTFYPAVSWSSLQFGYLAHEANGVREPQVCSFVGSEWLANEVAGGNPMDCIGVDRTEKLTVFSEPEIYIPKSFTPNHDGVGDFLEVVGGERYANSRLIIFSQQETARVLLDKSPYLNDFDGTVNGTPLPEQTYFYIYYKDAENDKSPKKGYFELVR